MSLPHSLMASLLDDLNALEALVHDDQKHLHRRLIVMGVIFVISLVAVSFPGISKRSTYLPIPKVVFFIGKHFGTGVILSTAFCHLLQDSFEALQNPLVAQSYGKVGDQCALIILGSLLSIFLIEYISTSYVDHLHAEPSEPTSPVTRVTSLPPTSEPQPLICDAPPEPSPTEDTPLLSSSSHSSHTSASHQPQHYLSSIITNTPRHLRSTESYYIINDLNYHVNHGEYQLIGGRGSCVCVCVCPASAEGDRPPAKSTTRSGTVTPIHTVDLEKPRIGRRRQVVGILVLQLGIMIHSLVIGLTLSITHGAEFTSLVTAIIFHQLFEGLSLGIRIAALPPSSLVPRLPIPNTTSTSHSKPLFFSVLGAETRWQALRRHWLPPVLSLLFAVTTPLGLGGGMLAFSGNVSKSQMLLTQGLMSAISAGMLIYAATVEMIAGDFVFGNLNGHEHGGHEHEHGGEVFEHEHDEEGGPTPGRKVLAVVSLLAGVLGMGLVGIGE
ncbi:ZIP zinc transporter-domain-containing protein [Desarmillaria tabescens]|uniref:ZIP zinc transporter-domain-containing protein n=1 Tax=Armillaria tabescens TaxID=1929756 RepID=A0AA39NI06_ARMTA|nr:ZIP zinc transporter-domain-containing protein [Desarmillaria tabescens]KAK0465995.1 ZIP zinc transporter-domain-containing protein [Desarmillaria tabescens]